MILNCATTLIALAGFAVLTACSHAPAVRTTLPDSVDAGDGAIAVIGDLQQTSAFVRLVRRREDNAAPQRRLIDDLRSRSDELAGLVIVGDLVYTARSARHWRHFDSLIEPFAQTMPVLPAIGNHDYPCFLVRFCRSGKMAAGMTQRFAWMRPGQPYAVDAGPLLMLFIDTESRLESQGVWLRERLAAGAGRYCAALVFYHRPAFSNSLDRGAEGNADVQRFIVPALTAAALPVVAFSGHIHGYEHIVRDGVHYVTTAGGGGPRGPMPAGPRADAYRGPECIRERDGAPLRPFNYVLLRTSALQLQMEIRGFCRGDADVRVLDTIRIALDQ